MTSSRSMDPLSGESPVGLAGRSLDQVLKLFEQGHMSATEMRVLLALREHADSSIAELARELGARPAEITRAGRRLAMRGLVRWHYGGRPEHALLEATASGAATIGALLTTVLQATAVAQAAAVREGTATTSGRRSSAVSGRCSESTVPRR